MARLAKRGYCASDHRVTIYPCRAAKTRNANLRVSSTTAILPLPRKLLHPNTAPSTPLSNYGAFIPDLIPL
ncbi:hypothetical protein E2542_SST05191 [Spatholobus suberectus]|nr:hypothetical protein E2542_SST05191 [Spatholobus suberectus]